MPSPGISTGRPIVLKVSISKAILLYIVTLPLVVVVGASAQVNVSAPVFVIVYAPSRAVPDVKSRNTRSPVSRPWFTIVTVMVALGLVRLYVPDFCCVGSHTHVFLADTVALVTVIDFKRTGACVTSSPVLAARADLTSVCIMALPVENSHRYRGRRQQAKQTALRKNAFARNQRVERRT